MAATSFLAILFQTRQVKGKEEKKKQGKHAKFFSCTQRPKRAKVEEKLIVIEIVVLLN